MTDIKYPKGYQKGDGTTQLAVRFPHAVFEKILRRAKREKKEFNDMVIELCKCGELCLHESDIHDEPRAA